MQVEFTKDELQMIHDALRAHCWELLKIIGKHTGTPEQRQPLWAKYKAANTLCEEMFEALTTEIEAA